MRERATQKLSPKMGRMGAEDPLRDFRPGLYSVRAISYSRWPGRTFCAAPVRVNRWRA